VRRRHVCVTADQRGRTAAGSLCGEDSPERERLPARTQHPRVISHSTRGMSNSFVVSLSFVFLGVR